MVLAATAELLSVSELEMIVACVVDAGTDAVFALEGEGVPQTSK